MKNTSQILSWSPDWIQEPYPWVGHMPFAYWLMGEVQPGVFVELGTHAGNSYFSFCQAVRDKGLTSHCYAVDTWEGDNQAGFYGDEVYEMVNRHNESQYKSFSTLYRMTFYEALGKFQDRSVDLLHIDGLHTYEAVRHDFEAWLPKLAPGAIVLFHDIAVYGQDFGVWKLWRELKNKYPRGLEFLHSAGLGVLQISGSNKRTHPTWLEPGSNSRETVIKVMEAAGEALMSKDKSNFGRTTTTQRPYSTNRLGFWRQLEQNIRKQRYRWTLKILFDPNWYRKAHADLAEWGGDPWEHYLKYGRDEGRGLNKILNFVTTRVYRRKKFKSFSRWLNINDQVTPKIIQDMEKKMAAFSRRPLISVIMPVYNTKPEWLRQAIESVCNQIYPHWELCIADDASTERSVIELLKKYHKTDLRIKVVYHEKNANIVAASNSALALATGAFVAFLDNDDRLPQDALYWVAEAIDRNPEARLLYSDWDGIDENGVRHSGYFKPDFNYELLLAQNYVSQLGVYCRELACGLGGFRKDYEGSQDWDLALRAVAAIRRNQIVHIPRILYHRRQHSSSVSNTSSEMCAAAGRRAVAEHLQLVGGGSVETAPGCVGFNRIKFPLPTALPLVSIIICTRDQLSYLSVAVESIRNRSTYPNYEIVIIDNGSEDRDTLLYLDSLALQNGIRVIRDDSSFNYSRLNNSGLVHSRGELVCLLNNDIEVITPDWLEEMVSLAIKPDVGAVGARLWYPNGTLQHGGVIVGFGGVAGHYHLRLPRGNIGYFGRAVLQQEISAVTGACLMVRRKVFDEVGGLDEQIVVAFNDIDFCLRLRAAGYRNIWTPFAELIHHESASRGHDVNPEKIARFRKEINFMYMRWGETLEQDPFHNPNLSTTTADYPIRLV
jgi:glycosyltransferase involved in cell wall biosynthesis